MSNRSDAAKKGWKTRRANERREKKARERRSEAARRGWETRRAIERERRDEWIFEDTSDWIVEEPIDEVGGKFYE